MSTKGVILEQAEASMTRIKPHGGVTNPAVMLETAAEKTLWQQSSPWVHGVLGVVSFVPGVSLFSGGLDASIYAAEGNVLEAGIAAASMIPGGKLVTTAGKVVKGAVGIVREAKTVTTAVKAAEETAKVAKIAEDTVKAAKAAEEAAQAAKAVKVAQEAKAAAEAAESAKLAQNAGGSSTAAAAAKPAKAAKNAKKDTTVKKKSKGPCDHLRQGNGKGPYRGGAHNKTSQPVNDMKDSHHMPAKEISPLNPKDGPAIQMEPVDHRDTTSNGNNGHQGRAYRAMIEDLLKKGDWRKAMAIEIQDVRRIAKDVNDPRKYNEAMLEMMEYFKCLEKHGLLK
ncbi:hypothetical protein [Massilia antarctica]|uniref:hypothetical protein n=1 Tax=Massilia antarctica TaxID=2765360 RepID=UPI002271C0D6|nr:hypothetical protein [Massilia sp. H27-R4]MCY0916347.1 hypothetical protein [Massilia sp. H27-R4]